MISYYLLIILFWVLDTFEVPVRAVDKPLRLSINDFYKGGSGGSSVTVIGRLDSGSIQVGESLQVMPIGEFGTVKAMEVNEESVKWAIAGDFVSLSLDGLDVVQLGLVMKFLFINTFRGLL